MPPGPETTVWTALAPALAVLGLLMALGSQARLTRVHRCLRVLRATSRDPEAIRSAGGRSRGCHPAAARGEDQS